MACCPAPFRTILALLPQPHGRSEPFTSNQMHANSYGESSVGLRRILGTNEKQHRCMLSNVFIPIPVNKIYGLHKPKMACKGYKLEAAQK
jgi:hypothetical protein